MTSSSSEQERLSRLLLPLCQNIPPDILQDFLSRMDPDYFLRFEPATIAHHIGLIAQLSPDHPCEIAIADHGKERFTVTIVAYDYFSEFAVICGLLSAFGLNIEEGRIYTFSERPMPASLGNQSRTAPSDRHKIRPGLTRKKIVDVFLVQKGADTTFGPTEHRRFMSELTDLLKRLDAGQYAETRQAVNRRLIERLGKRRGSFSGLLHTVHITFDNSRSPTDTVMEIQSDDTPAFLYAFANALAMRNIYLSKAQVESVGAKIHDRFFVRNRHGHKLLDHAEQEQLRLTAVLIKQFTHALTWAPDPARALEAFDQFLDLIVQDHGKGARKALSFVRDKKSLPVLARLLGASDFLWEDFLRRQYDNLLPLLQNYKDEPLIKSPAVLRKELNAIINNAKTDEAKKAALNRFKDRELFRIDMKHIIEPSTSLPDFSLAITQLAEAIVDRALADCRTKLDRLYGPPKLADRTSCPFAVFGAGKFGGREMGYASDIEVLFVYGGPGRTSGKQSIDNSEYFERLAQELLQRIEAKREGIFHLDVRLRPHGDKGSLANAFDEIRSYYSLSGLAAPFERQALIKLRFVAGDSALGKKVEAHRDGYVYSGAPWDLAAALELRRQQIAQFVKPGQVNLKHSHGGIVTIEYAVQYLQLMHGHKDPRLRTPNTLQALAALIDGGIIPRETGEELRKAYLFIRMLIDGLRMVRGNTKDLVLPPPDSDELIFLARRVGYMTDDWQTGARHLQTDIEQHMSRTREFFERTFGRL